MDDVLTRRPGHMSVGVAPPLDPVAVPAKAMGAAAKEALPYANDKALLIIAAPESRGLGRNNMMASYKDVVRFFGGCKQMSEGGLRI
jgi:hypothetical protein